MPVNVLSIAPIAEIPAYASATAVGGSSGITPTTPLYLASDPTPRSETHRASNGTFNASQKTVIDAHIASPDPSFPGVVCTYWNRPGDPNPFQGLLSSMGLTTDSGLP